MRRWLSVLVVLGFARVATAETKVDWGPYLEKPGDTTPVKHAQSPTPAPKTAATAPAKKPVAHAQPAAKAKPAARTAKTKKKS
jgi:hypothetical protein